ncbi:hypothetical protein [Haloechinothrix halophila]|uniref:hypothetical protein n=1 Tax=Haloechinothrix halophila TaxID=1069073 RepID=UPI000413DF73|nr:hypothetical protein [Haloechinothrix halophila]
MTTPPVTTAAGVALPLADRALRALDHHRDPDGFADRHTDWPEWTRRAAHARHRSDCPIGPPPT